MSVAAARSMVTIDPEGLVISYCVDAALQEYYDYIFPEEGDAAPALKILQAAERWKREQKLKENNGL